MRAEQARKKEEARMDGGLGRGGEGWQSDEGRGGGVEGHRAEERCGGEGRRDGRGGGDGGAEMAERWRWLSGAWK